jgi:general secretion pathway protein D
MRTPFIWLAAFLVVPCALEAQMAIPPGFGPRPVIEQPKEAPAPAASPKSTAAASAEGPAVSNVLNLHNAPLTEVVDILARQLKINYILDPGVKGSVMINTYGEVKPVEVRALLETILRINGCAMVQVGDVYRIVPAKQVTRLPLSPQVNLKAPPDEEQMLLNLVFLKYAMAGDLSKLLEQFIGEGATLITHETANLLIIQDNGRNMRRTMDLIAMFDSDTFAEQRIRLFDVKNSKPSDVAKELERLYKAISLGGDKGSPIKFIAIDRINAILAVAPNPGVFDQVSQWVKKLDVAVQASAGSTDNFVYRVKYGRAECLAMVITSLYGGSGSSSGGMGMMGACSNSGGMGGMGGMSGMGGYGSGGMGGYGSSGMGGYGSGGMGGYGTGMSGYGMGGYGTTGYGTGYSGYGMSAPVQTPTFPTGSSSAGGAASDQTGGYLTGSGAHGRVPRIIPNPMDNTLLIQATQQEYDQILKLLKQLDVPPRQVLLEVKIYEVKLTDALSSGTSLYLQSKGASTTPHQFMSSLVSGTDSTTFGLSAGMVVGKSRELLGIMSAAETTGKAKTISAPNLIATDNIMATLNVGDEVPTLSSQAISSATSGGSSLFTNTINYRTSGITLNVMPRINPSGVVTLLLAQDISTPSTASSSSSIQSDSFSHRTFTTQVTLQDGDTIAIAGVITESTSTSSTGIPFLHRIPAIGTLFGSKSYSKDRTELVIFLTPRVIHDTNGLVDASDELKSKLKHVTKMIKD